MIDIVKVRSVPSRPGRRVSSRPAAIYTPRVFRVSRPQRVIDDVIRRPVRRVERSEIVVSPIQVVLEREYRSFDIDEVYLEIIRIEAEGVIYV